MQQVLQSIEDNGGTESMAEAELDAILRNLRYIYTVVREEGVQATEQRSEPQPIAQPETEPIVELEPQPEPQPEAEPTIEPQPELIVEPEPQPEPQPEIEPTIEPQPQSNDMEALKVRKSAMYSLYEEQTSTPTVGDSFTETRAIADAITAPKGVAESTQVLSLASAIGVADRFMLIRELFAGDETAYERTIATLDEMPTLEECVIHITENYTWRATSEGARFIMDILQRKHNA